MRSLYPLDHLVGMHTYTYSSWSPIDASIPRPEGFVVSEILLDGTNCADLFNKCIAGEIPQIKESARTVALALLRKIGISTPEAAQLLAKAFNCRGYEYLGLKEANAVSYQLVVLYSCKSLKPTYSDGRILACITSITLPIQHVGNEFRLVLEVKNGAHLMEAMKRLREVSNNGVLNFYGYQRFGTLRPINHEIGKLLLLNMNELAIDVLCKHYRRYIPSQGYEHRLCKHRRIPPTLAKFFLEAYQAYLFNRILSLAWLEHVERHGLVDALKTFEDVRLPVPGYRSIKQAVSTSHFSHIVESVLNSEGLTLDRFCRLAEKARLPGTFRPALVKPYIIEVRKLSPQTLSLTVRLPPGSYITIVLREILRCDPMKYVM